VRRVRLGVVANEFFALGVGRMGGFGWAARAVAQIFEDRALGVDVLFLTGELRAPRGAVTTTLHGRTVTLRSSSPVRTIRHVRAADPDVLLLIDYRPNYRAVCWALPRTPMIAWMRDPRPPEDVATVDALRIPGEDDIQPKGTFQPDCRSLGTLYRIGRWMGRPVLVAPTCDSIGAKTIRMLGTTVPLSPALPNPVTPLPVQPGPKDGRLVVAVLGRLDPYKRPWLGLELARRLPEVEFWFLGKAFHAGRGAWEPKDVPSNARFLGHVDGRDKYERLGAASVLLNTSAHEGLAVSFLEALACETPIVATVDPDRLVTRFGRFAGRFPGAGVEGLPALERSVRDLLENEEQRRRLGVEGRQFVEATHSRERFLEEFRALAARVGVPLPALPVDNVDAA
jgi:glycosyltransferase involved in cell wall biosynthesis